MEIRDLLRLARSFEIGIRTRLENDVNDLSHIRAVFSTATIDGSVRLESPLDAAVIIHHEIRIVPLPTQLEPRSVLGSSSGENGPIVHIQPDLLSVGIEIEAAPHAAAKCHAEYLVPRRTEIRVTAQR